MQRRHQRVAAAFDVHHEEATRRVGFDLGPEISRSVSGIPMCSMSSLRTHFNSPSSMVIEVISFGSMVQWLRRRRSASG